MTLLGKFSNVDKGIQGPFDVLDHAIARHHDTVNLERKSIIMPRLLAEINHVCIGGYFCFLLTYPS